MYFGKSVLLTISCPYLSRSRCDTVADWTMNLFIPGRPSFMAELFVLHVSVQACCGNHIMAHTLELQTIFSISELRRRIIFMSFYNFSSEKIKVLRVAWLVFGCLWKGNKMTVFMLSTYKVSTCLYVSWMAKNKTYLNPVSQSKHHRQYPCWIYNTCIMK